MKTKLFLALFFIVASFNLGAQSFPSQPFVRYNQTNYSLLPTNIWDQAFQVSGALTKSIDANGIVTIVGATNAGEANIVVPISTTNATVFSTFHEKSGVDFLFRNLEQGTNIVIFIDPATSNIVINASVDPGAGIPGDGDTMFQYNDGGVFGSVSNIQYFKSTGLIQFTNIIGAKPLIIGTPLVVTGNQTNLLNLFVSGDITADSIVTFSGPVIAFDGFRTKSHVWAQTGIFTNGIKILSLVTDRVLGINGAGDVTNTTVSIAALQGFGADINSRQGGNIVLTNFVATVGRNVTNLISLSTSNATSKPLTNSYTDGTVRLYGIEQGTNIIIFNNGSNYVINSSASGSGGGGGPGSIAFNSNQFDTNDIVSIKSGVILTNLISRGVTIPIANGNRVAYFNANSDITNSINVDSTELEFLDGVTSAIQTQINNIQPGGAGSMAFNLGQFNTNTIITIAKNASVTNLQHYVSNLVPPFGIIHGTNEYWFTNLTGNVTLGLDSMQIGGPIITLRVTNSGQHTLTFDSVNFWPFNSDLEPAALTNGVTIYKFWRDIHGTNGAASGLPLDLRAGSSITLVTNSQNQITIDASGVAQPGGPGSMAFNLNQFSTNGTVTIPSGALLSNIVFRGITDAGITANRVALWNANGYLTNSISVDITELEFLDGVTSGIQAQIDGKQNGQTNANQFGASTTLTLKDSLLVTNVINYVSFTVNGVIRVDTNALLSRITLTNSIQHISSTISPVSGSNVVIDFDGPQEQIINLTTNLVFLHGTNLMAGTNRTINVLLLNFSGNNQTIGWQASGAGNFKWLGTTNNPPLTIGAGKVMKASFQNYGGQSQTNIVAGAAGQQ